MKAWIDHETGTLTDLDGLRTLGVVPAEDEETGNAVYEIRAAFGDRTETTVTSTVLSWLRFTRVTEPQLMTLARFNSETAAKTYKRFIGMTLTRSGMRHETACVVPYVNEEDLLELAKKFKGYDAEMDAKAMAARDAAQHGAEDTFAQSEKNWTANI